MPRQSRVLGRSHHKRRFLISLHRYSPDCSRNFGGNPRGNPAILNLIMNCGLLPQFVLPLVGKSIPIRIIVRPEAQAAKLIHFEPVHHPVGITILTTQQVVGNCGGSLGNIHIDLADRHSGGPCLADTVYRPVGKIISIVRPIKTRGGERTVHFQVSFGLSDKSRRITLHCGKHHTGIRIDKSGG